MTVCSCGSPRCNWCEGERALGRSARVRRDGEVWAVVELEQWEPAWVRSLHATKAGAWRAAYERRYELAVSAREAQLFGDDPQWLDSVRVLIERREVLP